MNPYNETASTVLVTANVSAVLPYGQQVPLTPAAIGWLSSPHSGLNSCGLVIGAILCLLPPTCPANALFTRHPRHH